MSAPADKKIKTWQRAGAVVLALSVWQAASWAVGSALLLPGPVTVLGRLCALAVTAAFRRAVAFSFCRIAGGFALALVIAFVLALAGPLIAAHLYCFYFGILADDTPPVGLAAYAAAAIADTSPIATGIQGFLYDIRTAILPLMFIFNHDIILWGIDSVPEGIFLFFMTVLGCMSFASLTQGWFIAKNTLPDALLLACSTIIMLYPALLTGFFLPHDQRYWGYLIGIGIMGLLAYMQHARTTQTTEAAA